LLGNKTLLIALLPLVLVGMKLPGRELGEESWRGWQLRLLQAGPPQRLCKFLLSLSALPWNRVVKYLWG